MAKQRQKKAKKQQYHPDILYPFWAAAGGNVTRAMQLASEAGEKRVPSKPQTWAAYVDEHKFDARLKAEENAKWELYSKEREVKQQRVLDQIAHTFEEMADAFLLGLKDDFEKIRTLESKDGVRLAAEKRLYKLFGTMDAVDKFFRMYLRARGQPERISRNLQEVSGIPVGYGELETPPIRAKTPEEARKMAEEQA